MKKTLLLTVIISLLLVCAISLASCNSQVSYIDQSQEDDINETPNDVDPVAVQKLLKYTLLDDGTYGVSVGKATDSEEIVIPATYEGKAVTQILDQGFEKAYKLKSIVIPEGVVSIGNYAFKMCSGLKSIDLPDSLQSIGCLSFENCYSLKNIVIPQSTKTIKHRAFSGCTSLESATIGSNVAIIEDLAFHNCAKLKTVSLANGVSDFGQFVFGKCQTIESFNFDGTATEWESLYSQNIKDYTDGAAFSCTVHCTDGNLVYENGDLVSEIAV